MLNLLSVERVSDLKVDVKARLVAAIQENGIAKEKIGYSTIQHLICTSHGAELSHLKRTIDLSYSTGDTCTLLFEDLPQKAKEDILEHIKTEADKLNKETPIGKRPIKVLSDIDDSIYASLYDVSYPKSTTYPGVVSFYSSMDKFLNEDERGNLVFLTARPKGLFSLFRKFTFNTLKEAGVTIPFTMCSGSFSTIFTNNEMAKKKFENFEKFRQVYPEYRYVFNGDSGQGDIIAGQLMLKTETSRTGLITVFIHNIELSSGPKISADKCKELVSEGINMYSSYVEAAAMACDLNLLSATSLGQVVDDASQRFANVKFQNDGQKKARKSELDAATEKANAVIKQKSQ